MSPASQILIVAALISVMGIALLAVAISIASRLSTSRRQGLSMLALCLWCTLGGFTLSGAIWCWMTEVNEGTKQIRLQQLPPTALAKDVSLPDMAMLTFFVKADRWGRPIGYLTVVAPLILAILAWHQARSSDPSKKPSKRDELDALFRN